MFWSNFFFLRVWPLTGFGPQDLIEKSFYDFIHTEDILNMRDTHITCKYILNSRIAVCQSVRLAVCLWYIYKLIKKKNCHIFTIPYTELGFHNLKCRKSELKPLNLTYSCYFNNDTLRFRLGQNVLAKTTHFITTMIEICRGDSRLRCPLSFVLLY